jgi:hypothetical protein
MGVVVYKNCSGTSTMLFGVFNNTFNVLSSTSALITVITTNQLSFDVNGCYLKAEYWMNVTTAGTSTTGTVTFTVNEASEFIQFPTPVVTTQTYERSITSNAGLSGLFAKTNNFERMPLFSFGFSSSFFKLSILQRFADMNVGLSNVFSKIIDFSRLANAGLGLSGMFERMVSIPQIFERFFDLGIDAWANFFNASPKIADVFFVEKGGRIYALMLLEIGMLATVFLILIFLE